MQRLLALLMSTLLLSLVDTIALAQQPPGVATIGWLALSAGPDDAAIQALRNGLRDLGYIDGRDFRIEHRSAEGHADRLSRLAAELVRVEPNVILTATSDATRAAMRATNTIPIVAVLADDDPVALGFVKSLNRPGGNVTGITTRNVQLAGKRLELLKEMLPGLTRVAVFWDSFGRKELEVLKPAGTSLGVQLHLIDLAPSYDIGRAFREAKAQRAEAITVLGSAPLYVRSDRLGTMALQNKLPVIGAWRALVDAGGLMSYSTDVKDGVYRAAYLIDRLLKGAKASELPFEQTANIKLVVNMRTAQALGIAVPQSILLRADQLIR